ncbi:odorant receptor 24a-like isoform X1 [Bombus pascuorum]|uniref:odorant receptor 24a-like isoform X1 n=2 Tax=Bombus pascuorum TaxID=65598 RepID=UPI002136907C|nr:odorant receptor 24a-like isoform X1 [Bombus pascuorum]
MSKELKIYRKYASFVKRFLLLSGMCPITKERDVFYRCISIWSIFSSFISLCAVGNFCSQNVQNIALLTASFSLFCAILNTTMKACCFSIYQNKLQQANDILSSMLEQALSETDIRSIAFSWVRTFYRLIYIQYTLMTINSAIHAFKPLITRILYDANNTTNLQYPLPFPASYPWTINSMLVWQLHYLFDLNIIWNIISVSTGVDGFFSFCLFRISVMLRLLGFEFEMRFSTDEKNKANKEYEENRKRIFQECVNKHALLLKCRDIVQEAYGPVILLMTITSATSLCTLIFQVLQVKGQIVSKIIMCAVFISMKLLQTFLYAWPANVILIESDRFRHKVYFSDWYKHKDTSFAKGFTLILAQRSIVLKACNLMQVSLDLFVKVLNTAVSYYFLLETIDKDK